MSKIMRAALAAMLALSLLCAAALADEIPQPEGGRKFESWWGLRCGLVAINYEEEGYRVLVDLFDPEDNTGVQWEYACFYNEEKDVLESVSSCKTNYTLDPDTLDVTRGEYQYEGIDDEGQITVFSLSDDGALHWEDGREHIGQELEFRDIGCFDGVWRAEDVYTEFRWEGLYDESCYCYSVYIERDDDGFYMLGAYQPESGKLLCYDAIQSDEELFEALDAGAPCDAVFTYLGGDKLLYESDGAIELTYDLLGPES